MERAVGGEPITSSLGTFKAAEFQRLLQRFSGAAQSQYPQAQVPQNLIQQHHHKQLGEILAVPANKAEKNNPFILNNEILSSSTINKCQDFSSQKSANSCQN